VSPGFSDPEFSSELRLEQVARPTAFVQGRVSSPFLGWPAHAIVEADEFRITPSYASRVSAVQVISPTGDVRTLDLRQEMDGLFAHLDGHDRLAQSLLAVTFDGEELPQWSGPIVLKNEGEDR